MQKNRQADRQIEKQVEEEGGGGEVAKCADGQSKQNADISVEFVILKITILFWKSFCEILQDLPDRSR